VRQAERALKLIRAKARHFEELGLSMGGAAGVVGNKQRGTSRVELSAIGNVDALADLEEQKKAYMAIIAQAERVIEQISQEKYRQILTYRYLCGWSFSSISDELGYSVSTSVYHAHGWALMAAQKVLDEMEAG